MKKLLPLILLIFACNSEEESNLTYYEDGKIKEGILKQYSDTGNLFREASYKNGKLNGLVKNYSKNRRLKSVINYVNGMKDGESIQFYENGSKYLEILYNSDSIKLKKKYHKNGKLMSELKFVRGKPSRYLKEFYTSGSPKDLPTIKFDTIDNLATTGYYALKMKMSDGSKNVKFYFGRLAEDGCMPENPDPIQTVDGEGILDIILERGQFIMKEIHIIGDHTTNIGNPHLVESEYILSVENRN
jgi:hypothetical protein